MKKDAATHKALRDFVGKGWSMKFGRYVVFALMLSVLSVTCAYSQDAIMQLNSQELGAHQRPLATFTHEQHADVIDCLRCHHDFDKYGNNLGSEGQLCSGCHTQAAGENPIPLQDAFHIQCKTCHDQMLGKEGISGPIMCGECHKRE